MVQKKESSDIDLEGNATKTKKKAAPVRKKADEITQPQPSTHQTLLSYGVKPYEPKNDEEYMSKTQREHFRNLLNLWKNDLLKGGDDAINNLKELVEVPADISDQATIEELNALKLRRRDRERKLIDKIDESIRLIDSNDYGYCEECGIEIGIRRLEARPTATLCIDCKTLAEVREKQGR